MRIVHRILILAACLLAAIACYAFGFSTGTLLFVLLGIAFEGLFWLNLFRRKRTINPEIK